jgi:hypothetical protein
MSLLAILSRRAPVITRRTVVEMVACEFTPFSAQISSLVNMESMLAGKEMSEGCLYYHIVSTLCKYHLSLYRSAAKDCDTLWHISTAIADLLDLPYSFYS